MVAFSALNAHVSYPDVVRYWSPISEPYAGGDQLITLLQQGWQIKETIFYETYWHAGTRPVEVYHMSLLQEDETMTVRVLANPYVDRFAHASPFQLRPISERTKLLNHH